MRNSLICLFELNEDDVSSSSEAEELIRVVRKNPAKQQGGRQRTKVTSPLFSDEQQHGGEMSALHVACRRGQLGRVRNLLRRGDDDVNKVDDTTGRTPLMHACRNVVSAEVVHYLLTQDDVDVHACTSSGLTALEIAGRAGNVTAVRSLLRHGAEPGRHLLHRLCRRGRRCRVEIVDLLVRHGADVHAALDGSTPLHVAAHAGVPLTVVECLVEHGAAPHTPNRNGGVTPLHVAYRMRRYDIAEYLLERTLRPRRF